MIGGNVTSDGGLAVTARGVCWSTSHNPTLSNSFTIDSSGIGSFTSGINGLTSGTTYFVRAYATNSLGTAYGNEVSFTTAYSLLDGLVAYYPFNGNANDESGNGNNGTVYGANLTTDRFGNANSAYSFDGASYYIQTTSLSHTLTNKTYNAWVYLNDNNQIGGGLIGVQFNDASVFDAIVYNETNTGWGFGSDNFSRTKWSGMKETHYSWVMLTATYEQNTYKLYRNGILIDSTNQFSIINFPNTCKINIGIRHNNGDHAFINGTIDDVSVYNRTLSKLEIDSLYHEGGWPIISQQYQYAVYDYDGNGYDTVRIGTQTWMKQNLKVTHYRNGSEIPHRNVGNFYSYFDAGYCNYNDDDNIASVYGRLYNYYAAAHPLICPTGWHVPSLNEWGTLMDYVGGDLGKLKETGTAHWSYPNTGATNETGFTAIAGGYNYWGAGYHDIGLSCVFWSSTLYNTSNLAWNMGIYYKDNIGGPYYNGYSFGVSVRCIKDALATVSTEAASGVLGTTAMCGGNVTYDGGLVVTARGVCWSTSHNPTIADSYSEDGSGMGIFSSNLTGLSPCTTYYVRAYATNSLGTSYGNEISFSTILNAPVGDSIQTFYNAVTIADLVVTGNSIKWYDIQSGGNELLSTNSLVNGNTYYASQTIGGCESQSRFGVTVSLNLIKTVNLHLFLEGLFDPSTGNSMVEAQDIDWNAGITFAKYGSGVADKIQVDLFEENAPYNPIGVSISGIDLTTNGLATFQVSPSLIGNYYIRVRTRNHLETWSTIAVPFNTSPIVWDFTINAYNSFQASGGNDPQVQIAPGLYAFYLGDLDQSLNVDFDDFNLFEPYLTNGIYGFTIADFNGNGLCDFDDFNLFEPRLNEGPFAQYPGMP
ncbi:MAG: FISUMP domain-containing protein [Bacteroidota bacterium]